MKKTKIFLTLGILFLFFLFGAALKTSAGPSDNVLGWLWGGSEVSQDNVLSGNETGVGWLSMNSLDTGSAVSYGVNVPIGDGDLSGMAWSENLGWISFDAADQIGCPYGACKAERQANEITGWARILGIKDALAQGNSGGWQGFIQLGGPNGVKIDPSTGAVSGYGWNGEEPGIAPLAAHGLGWINFSGATVILPKNLKVCKDTCSNASQDPIAISGGAVGTLVVPVNSTTNLKACFGTNTKCDDLDVTPQGLNTWTPPIGDTNNAIESSQKDGSNFVIKTSNNTGDADFQSRYTDALTNYQASFKVTVFCPGDSSCKSDTCQGKKCYDSCGNEYNGEKDCVWKEVNP